MPLRTRYHESPQPLRFHTTDEAPAEKVRPAEGLEVEVQKEGRLVEELPMKNEQEGCPDGLEGYEDDLEWYEEWMQVQSARQPA